MKSIAMIRMSSTVFGVLLLVAAISQAQEGPEGQFWVLLQSTVGVQSLTDLHARVWAVI